MYAKQCLNKEEYRVAHRVNRYFKSDEMSFQEKLFQAMLIAQYELEGQHYDNDQERVKIARFKGILDGLLHKVTRYEASSIASTAQDRIGEE